MAVKITKFKDFKGNFSQKFYAFDFDDNILMLPTKIHMMHNTDGDWVQEQVSTEKFAEIRNHEDWKVYEESFVEFRDFGPRGTNAYLDDIKEALKNKMFGPSWKDFVKCITKANIFAIITARGHEPSTMKRGVEHIIYNVLTTNQKNEMAANIMAHASLFNILDANIDYSFDYLVKTYMNNCYFYGVNSDAFATKHPDLFDNGKIKLEAAKEQAMKEFMTVIHKYTKRTGFVAKLGFSDDDSKNVECIKKFFNEKKDLFNDINFRIYDTSNGVKKKTRI